MENPGLLVMWYLVFLISLTFHEAAHGFIALKLGDPTAYHNGQVSFNPIPHFRQEPIGMILVPLISFHFAGWMFGWASVPYDPIWAGRYPKRAALMALAGPVANLILVLVAALLIRAGMAIGMFCPAGEGIWPSVVAANSPGFASNMAMILSIMFTLNLILFVFNLFPLPPLDGSGILPLIMSRQHTERYLNFVRQPGFSIMGLLMVWHVFPRIFVPVFTTALNMLYFGAGYK